MHEKTEQNKTHKSYLLSLKITNFWNYNNGTRKKMSAYIKRQSATPQKHVKSAYVSYDRYSVIDA